MAIIGIDLGTTNSLVTVWKDGKAVLIPNQLGEYLTPSVVGIDSEKKIWVGAVAKEQRLLNPQNCIGSFKRFIGTDWVWKTDGVSYNSQELSAIVLRQLKKNAEIYLNEPVEEAVISVPAYFNDGQRYATREAGILAGLKVERLINEPSAAALACRNLNQMKEELFLVVDCGGGTLDVSVVECFDEIIEIEAVAGDNHLGGDDFDKQIAAHFCKEHSMEFEKLTQKEQTLMLKKAETCKRLLSEKGAGIFEWEGANGTLGMILTEEQMVAISAPLLKRMEEVIHKALRDSGNSLEEIDQIVLVGGTCRMPMVSKYFHHILGMKPVLVGNADEIVALGVGVYAGIKERKEEIKDILLTDICPFTLGVGVRDKNDAKNYLMSPVIERNSVLPNSKVNRYVPVSRTQKGVKILIFQGESMYCNENLFLGWVEIDLPKCKDSIDTRFVMVRFTYDINGILEVEVEGADGRKKTKVLLNNQLRMGEEEVQKRIQQIKEIRYNSGEEEINQLLLLRGKQLYKEYLGKDREFIMENVIWYQEIIQEGNPAGIRGARKRLTEIFNYFENKMDKE